MSGEITYVGHATVAIDLDGVRILTDPVLRDRVLHIRRSPPPVSPDAIAGADAVLISHLHADHLDLPSIRKLGARIEVVVPAGGERLLRRCAVRSVRGLRPGESTSIGGIEVIATPAVHNGRRHPLSRKIEPLGYELRGAGHRIYFAGDTDLFPQMRQLTGVDVALLPIGGWGTAVRHGHLDPERAVEAAKMIQPGVVVPIHWGTLLRAGLASRRPELLSDPARRFAELMSEEAPGIEVRILEPGASLTL